MIQVTKGHPLMKFALFILVPIGLIVGADFLYASWLRFRHQAWEKTVERLPNGVRVNCEAFTVGEGDTAILCVHGYADVPAVYRTMAPELAARGYTCRALRLPGFGEPMAAYRRTSRAQWLDEVRREVEALRTTHDRVWIAGHSTGGALALQLAGLDDGAIDGIVLLAPLLKVSSERSPILPTHRWFAIGDRILHCTDMVENVFPIVGDDPEVGNYPYRDLFVPLNVVRDLFGLMAEVEGTGPAVSVPVLLFQAGADKVVDNPESTAYFDSLASPVKERIELPRSGHAIMIDSDWTNVVEEMHRFIRAAPAAGAQEPR